MIVENEVVCFCEMQCIDAVLCCGCSDLAMILCDSQAVEVLAITVMKTLQHCSTSDLLPRVSAEIF